MGRWTARPTHSWMQWLYRYPQAAFPYDAAARARTPAAARDEREYELADTGVLDDNRFFDVQVTYAKAAPDDICILIEATNHGPDAAPLHLLPQIWFRNTWAWGRDERKPTLQQIAPPQLSAANAHAVESRARLSGPLLPGRRGHARRCWSATTRPTTIAAVRRGEQPVALPEGRASTAASSTATRRRSTRTAPAPRPRSGTASTRSRPAKPCRSSCGCRPAEPDEQTFGPAFDAVLADRRRRGRRVLRQRDAGRAWTTRIDSSPAGPSPACCGASSSTATRSRSGSTATRVSRTAAGRAAERARNIALAARRPGRRHLDAGRVGVPVVRRLGPRVPLACRWPTSIRRSPRSS